MHALFQFFAALLVAMAAMVLSEIGAAAGGIELRSSPNESERSVKRSPVHPHEASRPHAPA